MAVHSQTRIVMAYLLDRAEQYRPDSGYQTFIGDLVGALADGEHIAAYRAGELDDLKERVDNISRKRPRKAAPAGEGAK